MEQVVVLGSLNMDQVIRVKKNAEKRRNHTGSGNE